MNALEQALEELRRAEGSARRALDAALTPLGLGVSSVSVDGDEWVIRARKTAVGNAPVRAEVPAMVSAPSAAAETPAPAPRRKLTDGVRPVERHEGETLMQLLARTESKVTLRSANGHVAGLSVNALDASESVRLLASTLVGDTFLAFEHLKVDPKSDQVVRELGKQLKLFRDEAARTLGGSASVDLQPFLEAVERWVPGQFPAGVALVTRLEEAARA